MRSRLAAFPGVVLHGPRALQHGAEFLRMPIERAEHTAMLVMETALSLIHI